MRSVAALVTVILMAQVALFAEDKTTLAEFLMKKYPDTKAAAEAKELLETFDK